MTILNLLAPKTSAPVVTTAKNDQLPATPRVRPAASNSKPYRPVPIPPPRRPDASKTLSDLLNRPIEHRMAGWTREEDREVNEEVYILSEPNRIDMPKYLEHLEAKAKHHNSSDESEGDIFIDDSSRECSAEGEAIVSALVGSSTSTSFNQIHLNGLASDDGGDSDGENKRRSLSVSDEDRIVNVGTVLRWENELVVEQALLAEEVGEESFEALLRNVEVPDGMRMIPEIEYTRLKTVEADHATIVNELDQANLTIDRIQANCEFLEQALAAQIQPLPRGSSIASIDDGRDREDMLRDNGDIGGDQSDDDANLMRIGEIDDAADLDVQSVVDGPEHAVAAPLDDTEMIQSFLDAASTSVQDWNAFERHSIFDADKLVELQARKVEDHLGRMQSSWTTQSAKVAIRSHQKFYRDYDVDSTEWRDLMDTEWKRLRYEMRKVIDLPVAIGNQLIEMQYPGLRACEEGSWMCNALRQDVRASLNRSVA